MTDFPTLLYRVPGEHRLNGGQTYAYKAVADEAALKAARESGWSASLAEAVEDRREEVRGTEGPTEERKALEEEAKGLKVSFNWKTDDETLVERILAAKAAKEKTDGE
jgi:hypothetical protein